MSIEAMQVALGALDWAADHITPKNPINCDCPVCVASDVLRRAIDDAAPLQERIQLLYEQLNEAEKQLGQQYKLGMEAEREACAKLCDEVGNRDANTHAWDAAAAIRARGSHA